MSAEPRRPGYWLRLASLSLLILIIAIAASVGVTQAFGYSNGAGIAKGVILAVACLTASILIRRLR